MENIKQHRQVLIASTVVLLALFYWFQLRPTMIKSRCSWQTEIVPADAGITKEQADVNKKALEQNIKVSAKNTSGSFFSSGTMPVLPPSLNTIERPPQPEHEVTREANKSEYAECLQHHGI